MRRSVFERERRGGTTYWSFLDSGVLDVRCDQFSSDSAVQSGESVLLCELNNALIVGGAVVLLTKAFATKMCLSWDAIS